MMDQTYLNGFGVVLSDNCSMNLESEFPVQFWQNRITESLLTFTTTSHKKFGQTCRIETNSTLDIFSCSKQTGREMAFIFEIIIKDRPTDVREIFSPI